MDSRQRRIEPSRTSESRRVPVLVETVLVILAGTLLTWMFWGPLWRGGGLVGGDTYAYYFPQKVLLAESLKQGVLPLWNPYVGFGYPVLGESQTGVLYPPNLLLYRMFDPNTAYNVNQLLHYVVAFVATWGLARRWGLHPAGALLAAILFVFGWFPARICHEWAIIGGAWFALTLWVVTGYLETRSHRSLLLFSLCLGLALLAGHYNLAFITLLTVIGLWCLFPGPTDPRLPATSAAPETQPGRRKAVGRTIGPKVSRDPAHATPETSSRRSPFSLSPRPLLPLLGAVACGFFIAAVQLLPSWELKRHSQRQEANEAFSPTYGHLPPAAISQLWAPWSWYAGKETMDEILSRSRFLSVPDGTNQVEAQLYLGLVPLALILLALLVGRLRRDQTLKRPLVWCILGGGSLIFATGWPTYWLSDLPGFGYFRGPGRYSIVAVLAGALLAGSALDAVLQRYFRSVTTRVLLAILLSTVTIADLWAASRQYGFGASPLRGRQVFYVTLVDDPPLKHLDESPLRQFFADRPQSRLYAPGPNVPSLLGVSSLPTYLGLGPQFYESEAARVDFSTTDPGEIDEAADRLRRFGVTHLLLESSIDPSRWPVRPLGEILDPFLNRVFARREPYYFYELIGAHGRVFVENRDDTPARLLSVETQPNRVRVQLASREPGRLVLADLAWPGWEVTAGSHDAGTYRELFRVAEFDPEPDGTTTIEWTYRPLSFRWGGVLSIAGIVWLCSCLWRMSSRSSPS